MSSFGVDFGQKVDLTASIRNILRNYPEGTAILKELVQNADDAGAKRICFTLDLRSHGVEKLAAPALAPFQGPSLTVYNDETFSKQDFESIQRIGDSLKKTDGAPKIGRFGIGFNAVYHWTDLPSFVSSRYLVLLDPQAKFLPDVNPSNPGKMVDFVGSPGLLSSYRDQFAPYEVDWSRPFNGTLFRLPLRTAELGGTSRLSNRVLEVDTATEVLQSLVEEANSMLLFLKNVRQIEVKIWRADEAKAAHWFTSSIANVTPELIAKRQFVMQAPAGSADGKLGQKPSVGSAGAGTQAVSLHGVSTADFCLEIACKYTDKDPYIETWDVCNQFGGGAATKIARQPTNALLKLVPWGGVAALISTSRSSEGGSGDSSAIVGQAYCFLPLPIQTELPVMVNGYFELSSNRRDIWQAGTDMTGDGKTRAEWNIALMTDVIAPSYVRLLTRARTTLQSFSPKYQSLWPSTKLAQPWNNVSVAMYRLVRQERLLYTDLKASLGGALIDTIGAGFSSLMGAFGATDAAKTVAVTTSQQWIACGTAIVFPAVFKNVVISDADEDMLHRLLIQKARLPLVLCTSTIRDGLIHTDICEHVVSPKYLRSVLCTLIRQSVSAMDAAARANTNAAASKQTGKDIPVDVSSFLSDLPQSDWCRFLLRYCLSDCARDEAPTELNMLPILPLLSKKSGKLSKSVSAIGTLRIFSAKETQGIRELSNMGFSASQALQALSATKFNLDAACDSLTSGGGGGRATVLNDDSYLMDKAVRGDTVFVLCNGEEDVEVFQSASYVLLDKANIDPNELKYLVNPSMQKFSNIRLFSPVLIPDLLRAILPPVCFSHSKYVSIKHLQNCGEIYEFIRVFFGYCGSGSRGDAIAAVAEGIAIVPSKSGLLYPLSKVSTLVAVVSAPTPKRGKDEPPSNDGGSDSDGGAVVGAGISSSLEELLTTMGCNFVDSELVFSSATSPGSDNIVALVEQPSGKDAEGSSSTAVTVPADAVTTTALTAAGASVSQMPKKFWEYVYSTASLVDMLMVFDVIQRSNHLYTFQSRLSVDAGKATAVQLDELRMFVINGLTNNTTLSDTNIRVLRRLPIYIAHQSRSYISLITATSASSQVALDARMNTQYYTLAEPAKIPSVLLTDNFLVHDARYPQELQLLQKLGVQKLSKCQYYKSHFLPGLKGLFAAHPAEATDVLVLMISEMTALVAEDRSFAAMLRGVAFVPAGALPAAITGKSVEGEEKSSAEPVRAVATSANASSAAVRAAPIQAALVVGSSTAAPATGAARMPPTTLMLRRADELYDPEQVELVSLLPVASFPCTAFRRTDILLTLRQFGLRTVMDWTAIIICAKGIQDMSSDASDDGSDDEQSAARTKVDRGVNLLKFLDKNGRTLFGNPNEGPEAAAKSSRRGSTSLVGSLYTSFFGDTEETIQAAAADAQKLAEQKRNIAALLEIAWVPVAAKLDDSWSYLPIRAPAVLTAKPSESRPISDAPMCSASYYLVSQTVRSSHLHAAFGWESTFSPVSVAVQLREIAKIYVAKQKELELLSSDGGSENANASMDDIREGISVIIPQLYAKLNAVSDSSSRDKEASDVVNTLDSSNWIWVGDTFVSCESVALTVSVNASPYLYQLPQDFCVYKRLLHIFHVKQTFTPRDYLQVLRTMTDEHREKAKIVAKASGGADKHEVMPLSETKLELAIALITLLAADSNASKNQVVYIPDQHGRLRLAEDLVNDDVPWMFGPECASLRSGRNFIHPNISTAVSEKFGVKSLRLVLLNQNVEQNIFGGAASGADGSGALEAFGQAESITNRLKTILDLYPEGNPIYSELIQNADDAGATVVKIMLDENSYGCESLLSQKMAPLQGPSLLVYNDALFTEADYRALGRIGQGSKLEKLSTTGRFGLGFNSTYHLTDTPSFVSGEYLVIFDPHCSYAPGATTNQPGLRIKCSDTGSGSQLAVTFKDQFDPFKHFNCDFKSAFGGTLFRFPLRTSALARQSEISKRHYTAPDILGSLDQLIDNISNHLLFLRNLRTIEVYRHGRGAVSPTLLYRAQAQVGGHETVGDQGLMKFFVKTPVSVAGAGQQSRDSFYNKLMSTPDARLPLEYFRMKIVCTNYKLPGDAVDDADTDAVAEADDVGVYMVEYFIVSGLSGGAAKKMACDNKNRHLKLVPMGAIAACLSRTEQVNGVTNTSVFPALSGTAFCFLPLPVSTQLPVHVNAYWELSSNRRDIWRGDDTTGEAKLRSDWNNCVAIDVLASLYAKLLVKLSVSITPSSGSGSTAITTSSKYDILNLLPCPLPQQDTWRVLGEHVLPQIAESCLIMWSNLKKGTYLSLADSMLLLRNSDSSRADAGGMKANDSSAAGGDSQVVSAVSYPVEDTEYLDKLELLLLKEGVPVVVVNAEVGGALIKQRCVRGHISPAFVRDHFSVNNTQFRHPSIDASASLDGDTAAANAVFLLQYAFRDVNRDNFDALHTVKLLPLEDGSLGSVKQLADDVACSPAGRTKCYFTVTDLERKILQAHCGDRLVAADTVLGTHVASCIRDPKFSAGRNVKPLGLADMIALLQQIVPAEWSNPSCTIVNRDGVFGDEWLCNLWNYLIDSKCKEPDFIPLLPVLQPRSMPAGAYMVKVSSTIPILLINSNTAANIDSDVTDALSDLGLYVFDSSVLGRLSFAKDIDSVLCNPTPQGLLDGLSTVCTAQCFRYNDEVNVKWTARTRNVLRTFVLDYIVSKMEGLSLDEAAVLLSLPIWLVHGYKASYVAGVDGERGSLEDPFEAYRSFGMEDVENRKVLLPPATVEKELLTPKYLKIRNEFDRIIYRSLHVAECSSGAFYALDVIPHMALAGAAVAVAGSVRAEANSQRKSDLEQSSGKLSVEMLRNLSQLENEHPGIEEMLKQTAFVSNSTGKLVRPMDLYDPDISDLKVLLPPEFFPMRVLYGDPVCLSSLRRLGMHTVLDCDGVLKVARAIASDFDAYNAAAKAAIPDSAGSSSSSSPAAAQVTIIVTKGNKLLRYLDAHMEELLADADQDGLQALKDKQNQLLDVAAPAATSDRAVGGAWGQELRQIVWIPTQVQIPIRELSDYLPWPAKTHASFLGAPLQTCPPESVWLCSRAFKVSAVDVKSEFVRAVLGWSLPVPGRIAALQLLSIQHQLASLVNNSNRNAATVLIEMNKGRLLEREIFRLYDCLQVALSEGDREVSVWLNALKNKPIVWVQTSGGYNMLETARVAFEPLSRLVNTEPFLYVVNSDLIAYTALLQRVGVRSAFVPMDIANLLRDMKTRQGEKQLTVGEADMCVGLLKVLTRFLEGDAGESSEEEEEEEEEKGDDDEGGDAGDAPVAAEPVTAVAKAVPVVASRVGDSDDEYECEEQQFRVVGVRALGPVPVAPRAPNTVPVAAATPVKVSSSSGDKPDPSPSPNKKSDKPKPKDKDKSKDKPKPEILEQVSLASLGSIFVPDTMNVLALASNLTFNDAEWTKKNPSLLTQHKSVRFVKELLDNKSALMLGCKSFREQLFSGDSIPCPGAHIIRSIIADDGADDVIKDLISMADALQCKGMHIFYDERTHAVESLLHPGLADTQGPALVCFMEGQTIDSEKIAKLLSVPELLDAGGDPSGTGDGTEGHSASSADYLKKVMARYPKPGKGIAAAFTICDCLQILSGNTFHVYDPCGMHLLDAHDYQDGAREHSAKAQKCALVARSTVNSSEQINALQRFPDQFGPILNLPYGSVQASLKSNNYLDGIVIRMPLRKAKSNLCAIVPTEDTVKSMLVNYRHMLEGCLLFAYSLVHGSCKHVLAPAQGEEGSSSSSVPTAQSVDDFELALLSAPEQRNQRLKLLVDKSWKSGGLSSMFSKAFVPLETNYDIVVALKFAMSNSQDSSTSYLDWSGCMPTASAPVARGGSPTNKDYGFVDVAAEKATTRQYNNIWKIMSILGPKRTRGEANRSAYSSAKLIPIISAAVLLSAREADQSPATPPPIGFYYNFGGVAAVSGLPVHFEGPFLQDYPTRELPLPVPACTRPAALERKGAGSSRRRSSVSSGYQHQLLSGDQIRTWNSCMLYDLLYQIYPQYLEVLRDTLFTVNASSASSVSASSVSASSASSSSSSSAESALSKSVRIYRYWPFLARLRPSTREYLLQCGSIESLLSKKFLLVKNGFESLDNVVVMTTKTHGVSTATASISTTTKEYVCNYLSLTFCPAQLTNEIVQHSIVHNFKTMTPSRLRDALRRDAVGHCRRLHKTHELVLEMLSFCVGDMNPTSGSGGAVETEGALSAVAVANSSSTSPDALGDVISTISDVAAAASSTTTAAVGDFARRALFKELVGVPLLITAANSVKAFPATARDRVVRVSSALQALMPQLANEFLHPLLLQAIPLFGDAVFREALSIPDFAPAHILENIHLILPSKWRRCGAVEWGGTVDSLGSQLSSASSASGSAAKFVDSVNPLFIYILWRDVLSRQDYGMLDLLADWPLLPVVSNGKHMLISPALLPYVTPRTPTAAQDSTRALLARESARLASVVNRETARVLQAAMGARSNANSGSGEDWAWSTQAAFSDSVGVAVGLEKAQEKPLPTAAPVANSQSVTATAVDSQPSSFTALLTGSSMPTLDGAVPVAEVQQAPVRTQMTTAGTGIPAPAAAETRASHAIPSDLLGVLERVGMPMLDCAFFDGLPAVLQSASGVTAGRRVLESMYELHSRDLVVFGTGGEADNTVAVTGGNVTAEGNMLNFEALSVADRGEVLKEVLNAHRTAPLPTGDVAKLKSLRLFTSSTGDDTPNNATTLPASSPIAINSANGVFWSQTAGALDGLTLTPAAPSGGGVTGGLTSLLFGSSSSSSSAVAASAPAQGDEAAPVVLVNDLSLRGIYDLVGAEELTPAIAVKRFTIPALQRMDPSQRHLVVKKLADKWGSYNSDAALVSELKTIAFIPGWCSSEDGEANGRGAVVGFGEIDPGKPVRCAKDVLTWTSDGLKQALKGPSQAAYYPPPFMAEPQWFALLTDLGATSELDKPKFLRVVTDIDKLVRSIDDAGRSGSGSNNSRTEEPDEDRAVGVMRGAFERGTKLLEYVKQDDHTASFLDAEMARKISKLCFVPVMKPLAVEAGGFVQYKPVVVRMNQTLSQQQGALAFSLMPVLEEALAPPQYFFSSLGICTAPSVDIVLKHFRNLINCPGDMGIGKKNSHLLDRWNADKFSIKDTFIAIYLFLQDHWKEVPLYEREALQTSLHCVPVGIVLAKPTRLFFRLAEDLSPFMHEVPRNFGACEEFLKRCLGIREAPDIADYKQFLQELTNECKDNALNPNELRAVLTIIRTIVDIMSDDVVDSGDDPRKLRKLKDGNSSTSGGGKHSGSIFVPDQNSVMQDTRNCVISDNVWLKSQAMAGLYNLGMHIVHPRIGRQFAEKLGIPKLSSIVSERIVDNSLNMDAEGLSQDAAAKFVQVFEQSTDLAAAIAALVLKAQLEFDSTGGSSSVGGSGSGSSSSVAAAGGDGDGAAGHSHGNIDVVENIPQILRTIAIKFVPSIHTFLVLKDPRKHVTPANMPPPPPGQAAAAATEVDLGDCSDPICFLHHHESHPSAADAGGGGGKTTTLLINSKLIVSPLTPEVAISLGICEYFELDKSIACSLGCVLAASTDVFYQRSGSSSGGLPSATGGTSTGPDREDMMTGLLSLLHIGCDDTTVKERLRGVPGEKLLECDVAKVELIPNAMFRAGDIVAYSTPSVSGAAKQESPDPQEQGDNFTSKLRYGKVMTTSAPDSVLQMSRIQVKTSAGGGSDAGHSWLLSTEVYSFKSARLGGGAPEKTAALSAGKTPLNPLERLKKAANKLTGTAPTDNSDNSVLVASASASASSGDPASTGSMEGVDVSDALISLMSRAGIPVSLEKQEFMARILELERTNRTLEAESVQAKNEGHECKRVMTRLQNSFLCEICTTNQVDTVLVPCGHTICKTCVGQLARQKCPFCRADLRSKVKFYLSSNADADDSDTATL